MPNGKWIDERCDRVKIFNAFDEPGRCSNCFYCNFLSKLKNKLEEIGYNTTKKHIQWWDIKYTEEDDILIVKPVENSSLEKKNN